MPEKTEHRPRDRWLIYSFVVGPLAALSQQSVMYVLVPTACAQRSNFMVAVAVLYAIGARRCAAVKVDGRPCAAGT